MFRKSSFQYDEIEPGIYEAVFEGVEQGPEAEGRSTVRWHFRLGDGRLATGLSSDKWTVGQRSSKAVQWVEAILSRTVNADEDPDVVIAEAVGRKCKIKVIRKEARGGMLIPTVSQVFPA